MACHSLCHQSEAQHDHAWYLFTTGKLCISRMFVISILSVLIWNSISENSRDTSPSEKECYSQSNEPHRALQTDRKAQTHSRQQTCGTKWPNHTIYSKQQRLNDIFALFSSGNPDISLGAIVVRIVSGSHILHSWYIYDYRTSQSSHDPIESSQVIICHTAYPCDFVDQGPFCSASVLSPSLVCSR
jgi:hypothetical protein